MQSVRHLGNQRINQSTDQKISQSNSHELRQSVSQSALQLLMASLNAKPFVDKNSKKAPFPLPKIMTHESHF